METLVSQGKKLITLSEGVQKDIKKMQEELKQAQAYLISDWSKFEARDFLGCDISSFEAFLDEFHEGDDMFILSDSVRLWHNDDCFEYSMKGEFLSFSSLDND